MDFKKLTANKRRHDSLFVLPPFEKRVPKIKRQVKMPDMKATLNEEQYGVFEQLVEAIKEPNLIVLEGYAGTGKTFMILQFIEWYISTHPYDNVAVAAPTNPAVEVLDNAADFTSYNVKYATIHKLLGLKEDILPSGKVVFKADPMSPASLSSYKLLILDEGSMLQDEISEDVMRYVATDELVVIFLGDPMQIPPIGQDDAIPMTKRGRREFGMTVFSLQKIVRQAEGNPIIGLTMAVRNNPLADSDEEFEFEEKIDNEHVYRLEELEEAKELFRTHFTSEHFLDNPDFCKVVAYRNKVVALYNKLIRRQIWGKVHTKIMVGERMIADKPIVREDRSMIFKTNDKFTVISFKVESLQYQYNEFVYYQCEVEQRIGSTGSVTKHIRIVHEDSEDDYHEMCRHLMKVAKGKSGAKQKEAWREYYAFVNSFAQVAYNYAVTAHKSQGSTYDRAFVVVSDILDSRNVRERNRILYTALSRPRSKLVLIG